MSMEFFLELMSMLSMLAGVIATAWRFWRWYKSPEGQELLATLAM